MQEKEESKSAEDSLMDNDYTSGFTENINAEMTADPLPEEKGFSNVTEYYVSASGHTRLFTAMRYGKRYVLKCLKPDFLFTPVYKQALTKEFEIGLQLEHPHICRTFALERLAGMGSTIVMEHIDGDSLETIIKEKRLSEELALKIASELMDALEYMHSKQITHRDIKPANIMLTHTGKSVKIIDFGLSDSDIFGVLKMPAGTYRYIAPEQLLPGAVAEPKADIYSLGMVIEDMAKITKSKRLKRIAKICTVKNPQLRPDSIEQLRRLIEKKEHERRAFISLCILVAILACVTIVSLVMRHTNSPADNKTNPADDSLSLSTDDNRIIDYQLWKEK